MKKPIARSLISLALAATTLVVFTAAADPPTPRRTAVSIVGDEFYINGRPTFEGRHWNGLNIQGLLPNSRMVQGIFDDRNPDTVARWKYPDSQKWDPDRNTREFLAAMADWRNHGLLAVTVNLQGGSPEGYSNEQPWHNSAIENDGSLRADYLSRLEKILDRADELGMTVILGYFYFGQDERLKDEAAILRAVDAITEWVLDHGYRNVLAEINNECDVRYDHAVLKPDRVHELIERVKNTTRNGRRLYAGTSYGGGTIPGGKVAQISDFILMHGNGVSDAARIAEMVRQTRALRGFWPKPILFNEDDHFDFEKPTNNLVAAFSEHASWGYFDPGKNNYEEGYQSPPVQWGINTGRKKAFFKLVSEITGSQTNSPGGATTEKRVQTRPLIRDPAAREEAAPAAGRAGAAYVSYHGWQNAILLSNGRVEAVIVPEIGRIMQFRFVGEEGPLWENRTLDGRSPDPLSPEWGNFGGDKTWPSPQSDWPRHTPRAWPPPQAFDSMPVRAELSRNSVVLTSPMDSHYGIKTIRRIELDRDLPVMRVTTTYEKVLGTPKKAGIWIITQLKDPVAVFAPVPAGSRFADGYNKQSDRLPAGLKREGDFLRLSRDRSQPSKIGTDADSLLWIGEKFCLRIDSKREPGMEYPDGGSSAEIYTNGDPNAYVELELLGPLYPMKTGSRIQQSSVYTLSHRVEVDPAREAARLYGR